MVEGIAFFVLLLAIILIVIMFGAVGKLAERYGRSSVLYVILSLLFTPFLIIVYLWCAGETFEHRRMMIMLDEKYRAEARKNIEESNKIN